jgi:hypothetical protein
LSLVFHSSYYWPFILEGLTTPLLSSEIYTPFDVGQC